MKVDVDDIVKNAKKWAGVVAEKASEAAESAKLEAKLRKAQTALDKEYKAFGQIMFQIEEGLLNREGHTVETACDRIRQRIDRIAALQRQKDEQKTAHKAAHQKDAKSEPPVQEADMPVEEETDGTEEEVRMPERDENGYFVLKFCPKCKVGNHPDAVCCVNCGEPFPKPGDSE